eukprot:3286425-Pyramimonas_sp.AAC.1
MRVESRPAEPGWQAQARAKGGGPRTCGARFGCAKHPSWAHADQWPYPHSVRCPKPDGSKEGG